MNDTTMSPFSPQAVELLQTGGLLALGASYSADALNRRDRTMGWLAACCLIFAMRHFAVSCEGTDFLAPDFLDRMQSLMAILGCLAIVQMIRTVLLESISRSFMVAIILAFPSLVTHYKAGVSQVDPSTVEIKMEGGFGDSMWGDDNAAPIFK